MRREDVEKLLGGYATGTLTPAERKALFEAALKDQTLFDALAGEQALKETVEDPACRARLIAALAPKQQASWAWLRRPPVWALAGSLAGTVLIAVVITRTQVARLPRPELAAVRAPAQAVPAQAAKEPAAPIQQKKKQQRMAEDTAAPVRESRRVAGGVVGGVIGGIFPDAPRKTEMPGPPPEAAARTQVAELPAAAAVPAAPPPQEVRELTTEAAPIRAMPTRFAAMDEQNALARSVAAGVARSPLNCKILRRSPDGAYTEVKPDTLRAGDQVRLSVQAASAGYLYILWRNDTGTWRLIYPGEGASAGANRVEPRRELELPPPPEAGYRFDGEPGDKHVVLVLSPHPERGFETGPADAVLARLRGDFTAKRGGAGASGMRGDAAAPVVLRDMLLRFR